MAIHSLPDKYPIPAREWGFLFCRKAGEMEENEVKKIKQVLRKGIALATAAVTMLSVFPTSAVAAASERAVITFDYCYDGSGNTIRYQQTFSHNGIICGHAGEARIRIYADGENAYCIEPGIPLHTGNTLEKDASEIWNSLEKEKQEAVNLALLYGTQGSMGSLPGTEGEKIIATQIAVWEFLTGCRIATAPYTQTDAKFYNGFCADGANGGVAAAYHQIISGMESHNTIPSFASSSSDSQAKELKWDGKQYVLELTDTNGVLSKFDFTSSNSDVKVSTSGNTMTITSGKAIAGNVRLSATKKIPTVSSGAKLVAYGDPSLQDIVTGVENTAAVQAYLNVQTSYGHVQIVKTSEDGVVAGLKFQITGNGIDKVVTTGEDGTIKIENLQPGTYTVTELTEDRYEPQESKKVEVKGGETAKVEFSNILRRGSLKVTKTSEDGLVEGMKFHLYGTSLSGIPVDKYAVTDSTGVAVFSDILISGDTPYILEEVETADRYVVPPSQNVMIHWKEVTNATFHNVLKKFRVTVTKTDSETGNAQGDGTLAGAVYGIYRGEELMDTYTTDKNGSFTTKYYVCGDNWTIREITPSEGYLLDETIYPVGAEAKDYTIELNTTSNDVTEQALKGKISIIKHTDDGSTQIETPEEGAEFQIYLKSAGSYDNAKDTERDTMVCDENGYAETKALPYGIYTVHQTKGWEGREMIDDFDVFIQRDGHVYRYLINNRWFESYLKIVKEDAETGKTIPLAGAGFQIYDESGKLVTMKYTYPEVAEVDTFYTGKDGYLITPETLPYGNYTLVEVEAPHGYVLDGTPIPFTIAEGESGEESGITVITVEKQDMPQKGTILVTKTGEEFASVQVSGDCIVDKDGNLVEGENIYTPVYKVTGQAGAVYEVIAAEDIVTPDGTIRAAAGEVVDTLTTDEEGKAKTKALYLGRYQVVEKIAPEGMVLNPEIHEVQLTYAGQEVSVTETDTAFYNERQKVKIDLKKILEQDEIFDIGNQGEIQNVAFGLYAAEDITAADGSGIPADGLLEVVFCKEDGTATFQKDLPFGKYYVKEVTTDQHYILSDKKYPVEFTYQGQDTEVVHISVEEGNAIENELIRGKISGLKVDIERKALEGATIGLFSVGTEKFMEETAFMVTTSDKDGAFSFENVPFGRWIVREIASPEGYVLNEALHYVSVTEDEEVIEIELVNKQMEGSVRLIKVDAEYPANKLTGAVFELYQDTDGDKEFSKKDTLLGEVPEISEGIYQMDHLLYGGYFVKEKTAPEGFKLDENAYYFEIQEDGKIVDVENETGVGFVNQPITGTLELTKKDISDGKLLPNAGFRIKDEDGNIVATGVTDKDGIAKFILRYGKYTYQEYNAPEGYEIDEKEYAFEIKEDGQIVKATMTNAKIPEEVIMTPKTGDDSRPGLWIALSALSGAGVAGFGFLAIRKCRKKKGEELV